MTITTTKVCELYHLNSFAENLKKKQHSSFNNSYSKLVLNHIF